MGDGTGIEALGNIGYIRRLWDAFESGGVAEMARLVPPDVTWRPLDAAGTTLEGTAELGAFWSSRKARVPSARMFHCHGDDVLVEAEYRRDDGSTRTVWLLYRFRGEALIEAIAFRSEGEARGDAQPRASG